MKVRIALFLLVGLLVFSGCTPVAETKQEQNTWDYDFGSTPESISTGMGWYALDGDFLYVSAYWKGPYIVEYDLAGGTSATIELPRGSEKPMPSDPEIVQQSTSRFNLFTLENHIACVDQAAVQFRYTDENGMQQWGLRHIQRLNLYDISQGIWTPVQELGDHVNKVIPVKKLTEDDTESLSAKSPDNDNPLAGIALYCWIGYDTFPEMAAQMAQDGIELQEPVDENERNKYIVDSLVYLDGDTRQTKILTKNFNGWFHVDDLYVYYIAHDTDGITNMLYRSRRDEINFELMDLGNIGNCVASYDGGFYFYRKPNKEICYYKDGEITELPIAGSSFQRWKDQIVFLNNVGQEHDPIKSYDVNTGEIRTLLESSVFPFSIVGDRYLGCLDYSTGNMIPIVIDLETGEKQEILDPMA